MDKVLEELLALAIRVQGNRDVIEVGTPGTTGVIRIHGDFSNPQDFKKRIDNAQMLRAYAKDNYNTKG